jgi:hypothetical protein
MSGLHESIRKNDHVGGGGIVYGFMFNDAITLN